MLKLKKYGFGRHEWLDWLRGGAILMVLGSHYQVNWRDAGIFLPWAAANMRFGWAGVDLFFVLSGFLVGGILISEKKLYGSIDLRYFYIRRVLKIWPLLYLVPIFFVAYSVLLGRGFFSAFGDMVPVFLHIQNYCIQPLGHLWSLAVEEHFYLILPIVIRYVGGRQLPWVLIIFIVSMFLFRCAYVGFGLVEIGEVRNKTHFRLDGLFLGVLLAWIYEFKRDLFDWISCSRYCFYCGLIMLFWPFAFNPNNSGLVAGPGFTSISIGFCLIVILTCRFSGSIRRKWVNLILRWLAWIGCYSFPIYLFHPFIWFGFMYLGFSVDKPPPRLVGSLGLTWITGFILWLFFSIGLGFIIGYLLERPLLLFRDKFFPARIRMASL